MGDALVILQILDLVTTAAMNFGVDFAKFNALRDAARAQNRMLTAEELRSLIPDAQDAIDSI